MELLSDIVVFCALIAMMMWCQRSQQKLVFKKVRRKSAGEVNRFFTHRKKPQWVTDKVIYLKALNPGYGCRKIAHTFNRLYEHRNESVSKSFVYDKLKQHQYQILQLRRKIKHLRPTEVPKNFKWGMDLTTVTDSTGSHNQILAIIDYGTRKCLCMQWLESKHTNIIIWTLLKTVIRYGQPGFIKTDNEAVFKSWKLNLCLWLLNIKHQYSDIASPWQNGRIERLIGTFKERIKKLIVKDCLQLEMLLPEFVIWYNSVRPHNYLDGKTPDEVWYETKSREFQYWQGWGGLLTGFKPARF